AASAISGGAEPDRRVAVFAVELRAARGAEKLSLVVPRAASEDAAVTRIGADWIFIELLFVVRLVIPVPAPLPDVAVHVVQAPGVRLSFSHRMGLRVRVAVVVSIPPQLPRIVPEAVSGRAGRANCPTGI